MQRRYSGKKRQNSRRVAEIAKSLVHSSPTIDLETGIEGLPAVRDSVVTVVEKWESLESLKAHLAAPHMTDYRTRVRDLVANTVIHVLQPA